MPIFPAYLPSHLNILFSFFKRHAYFIVLTFLFLISFSGHTQANASTDKAFYFINERLSYMKDVAVFKSANNINIEDKKREKVVLEKSMEKASELGLDPKSVAPFFQAQMDAAKAIQYRYKADWLLNPLDKNYQAQDLTTEIRPQLIRLGNETLAMIHARLRKGESFTPAMESSFIVSITTEHLTNADKKALYQGLRQIKLK